MSTMTAGQKFIIKERWHDRRQRQRRRDEEELARTNETIAFFRGLIVGCVSTFITFALLYGVWRIL